MDYFKKVLVLKQITEGFSLINKSVSGIVRLEIESGVCTLYLSLINVALKDTGGYHLFIIDGKDKIYAFELGQKPSSFSCTLPVTPDFNDGVSAGLSFIKDGVPELVAYAGANKKAKSVADFKKRITDKCLLDRRTQKRKDTEVERKSEVQTEIDHLKCEREKSVTATPAYDDEVVATENYYLKDEELARKLKIIEGLDDGYLSDEIIKPNCRGGQEKKEEQASSCEFLYETDLSPSAQDKSDEPYYHSVRRELDEIFLKFPEEPALSRTVDKSKWVRINYSDSQYYVVGIIYENSNEKYICYGVPAKYSPTPPKELQGFCSFIPLSVFDMQGDGYWMMFQDAVTGECIKLNGER